MRRALLLIGALLLALAPPAGAQSGDSTIVIEHFDALLRVEPEGVVDVTETIRFRFAGKWNGILRDLSLQHNTAEGKRQKLGVDVVSVTDQQGRALRMEEEEPDGWTQRLRIFIPGAHNAVRTVVIRYRVNNAIRYYFAKDGTPGFDELYWNVTGNEWTMPMDSISARLVLPGDALPMQTAAYTGYAGSTGRDAEIAVDSARRTVTFATTRGMSEGEGMTVAARWAPGAVTSRPSEAEHQALLAANRRAERLRMWPLGLPLLAFALAFRAWRRRGRDPREQSIMVGYEPPDGMSPAEMGTLIDHEAEMRDVTSTLVDLAVRGYVGIEERQEKHLFGLIKSTDYVFHLRRPRGEWDGLATHEHRFLDALFAIASTGAAWDDIRATFNEARRVHEAGGELDREAFSTRLAAAGSRPTESVRQRDLTNRFYKSLPGIKDGIYDRLVERGYYIHRPDKVKGNWLGMGIGLLVLGLFGAAFLAGTGSMWISPLALGVGAGVSAVVLIGFGLLMPARTYAGARAREASLGFREFLEKVESDRYRRMITSPEMFERYLPYAMAFGVEKRWSRAFDDLYREPPDWYSGSGYGHFRASDFSSRMSTMATTTGSSMQSSPSSSGSGGGGSSGGGSGGGGGSGF
ncbi:DUF2207 domain-containing protein [Longimicrobium sp.]|uniref:DUF2207 domain-containing protein n=1 Tax=Longimicrobium sp. TaxID=2029185 RepID=UPI003B3BC8F6